MRTLLIAVGAVAAVTFSAGSASAQNLTYVPIDTQKGLVQPTDSAINIFSGTLKIVNRAVADAVDSNGFVKTINNLLRRNTSTATTQSNGLPLPTLYPSTSYKNSFSPMTPRYQQFGQSVGGR